jgi:hypothetical protein
MSDHPLSVMNEERNPQVPPINALTQMALSM